jgi:glycosyltransferase involved in cell wall biosynthesis
MEPFLREAVDSVLRQPEVVELIVATHDGDSPTARLVAQHLDPRVRLVVSAGPSAGENLDAGVAQTEAPWLAFLDADDRWPAGRLAAGLHAAGAAQGPQLVLGQQRAMTADGDLLDAVAPAPLLGAALVAREAADRIGPFGASLIAQMRWLVRARELGIPTAEVHEVVLHRRAHAGNLSRVQRPELHRAYLALARERAAGQRQSGEGA